MTQPSPHGARDTGRLGLALGYLAIVIFTWGINYPLMKLALNDIEPLTFTAVRVLGGAAVLACVLWVTQAPLFPPKKERWPLAGISLLQYASVLGLTGVALLWLPAGRTITAIYTMPIWAVVFDILILKQRLRPLQIAGITISVGGILLFMDPAVLDWRDEGVMIGMTLTLTAALLWGLGAVCYRAGDWRAPLLSQTFWQLLVAGCVLGLAALIFEYPTDIRYTRTLFLILLWNWVVPTALGMWAWSKALNCISASIAGQVLMCTPFVGIAISAWMFQEDLPPEFAMSVLLIAVGGMLMLLRR